MDSPDLAELVKTMLAHKIVKLSAAGVTVELHESAFGQALDTTPQRDDVFANPPTDAQLQFWSVEDDSKPEEPS